MAIKSTIAMYDPENAITGHRDEFGPIATSDPPTVLPLGVGPSPSLSPQTMVAGFK